MICEAPVEGIANSGKTSGWNESYRPVWFTVRRIKGRCQLFHSARKAKFALFS